MGKKAKDLADLMNNWKDGKPNRTLRLLADKAEIKYNTVRRILLGEHEPECYTALSLLRVIATDEHSYSYLKEHFPNAAEMFRSGGRSSNTEVIEDIEFLKRDPIAFLILNMAYAEMADKKTIVRMLGEEGLSSAEYLIDKGLLLWNNDDELVSATGKTHFNYRGKSDVVDAICHILGFARKEHADNAAMNFVLRVTNEEKEQIKSMIRELYAVLDGYAKRKENTGPNLLAVALVLANVLGEKA